jgi:hypothetical protein
MNDPEGRTRLYRAGGNPDHAASAVHSLGEAERDAGRISRARLLFTAALREHRAFRNRRAMAYDLEGLAVAEGQARPLEAIVARALELVPEEGGAVKAGA